MTVELGGKNPNIVFADVDVDTAVDVVLTAVFLGNSFLRHARAMVLGGCSSHDSCIAFHPPRERLDAWEAMGCTGWGADDILPLVRRLEDNAEPGDHHGHSGPVRLRTIPAVDPCGVAMLEAAAAAGLPTVQFNDGPTVLNGAGWF